MGYRNFIKATIKHEGLEPNQTPFRITDPSMSKWTSMFDDTIKTPLNPQAKKSPGREKFLYTRTPDAVEPAVTEQFNRYHKRNPEITVADAVKIFDQTGAAGKLEFLKKNGVNPNSKIKDLKNQDEIGDEMVRQLGP